jgi:hypothetical protein
LTPLFRNPNTSDTRRHVIRANEHRERRKQAIRRWRDVVGAAAQSAIMPRLGALNAKVRGKPGGKLCLVGGVRLTVPTRS